MQLSKALGYEKNSSVASLRWPPAAISETGGRNGTKSSAELSEISTKLDKNDMLLIPRGVPYWFESSSKEALVIMRFSARAQNTPDKRIDYTERKPKPRDVIPDTYFAG